MPLLPSGTPGFKFAVHTNAFCTLFWLVMPFNLYILSLVRLTLRVGNALVAQWNSWFQICRFWLVMPFNLYILSLVRLIRILLSRQF
jgi:hypothetical protein